jgi:hypothetical protein
MKAMNFKKFTILNTRDPHLSVETEVDILINMDHVVSIKPIRIASPDRLVNGFWLRMTNGKKYKAVRIPSELIPVIGEEYIAPISINYDHDIEEDENALQ